MNDIPTSFGTQEFERLLAKRNGGENEMDKCSNCGEPISLREQHECKILAMPKIKNYRNPAYLKFIRSKRCIVCNQADKIHAHHEGFKQSGTGTKPPDVWTLPLCWKCHRLRHDKGFASFWQPINLDIRMEMLKFINEFLYLNEGKKI